MRERLFLFFLILGFGILLVRLFTLQILQGEYYWKLAEGNRIKTTKIPALRGVIYDRQNKLLVRNTPEGREYLAGPALSHVLGYVGEISQEELEDCKLALSGTFSFLAPKTNLKSATDFFSVNKREQASKTYELDKEVFKNCPYHAGDLVGKMGIEQSYDWVLRGVDGGVLEEVDAEGQLVRKLGERKPVAGKNLQLTLDLGLQQKIAELLSKEKKAAAVATVPQTGEVLALVSQPTFDPNLFTIHLREASGSQQLASLLNHPDQPLFNRAIAGQYPPGSTFKIVTALAGLAEGKLTAQTKIEDAGQITLGRWTYANWYYKQYGKTEGQLTVVSALKRSNDIFFYRLGEWLGIEKLSSWAHRFGLGEFLGIDLWGEAKGLVPDKNWKRTVKNEDWFTGDDFITAIGQGDLLATPLQINLMTGVVANGGRLCRPTLIQNAKSKDQKNDFYETERAKNNECRDLGIKKEDLDLVKEGMREACETGGTGWPFFKFKIQNAKIKIDDKNYFAREASDSADTVYVPVACKTGTAEAPGTKDTKAHAWFTVFAPLAEPEIVLTVLVENGGEGSSVAGPLAKEILKWWFEEKR